jgi:hypothetical protein
MAKGNLRIDILESKTKIENWISENKTKAYMCRELKCKAETLDMYLEKMDLYYKGNQGAKGQKNSPKRKTALEYLTNVCINSNKLKIKLFEDFVKEKKCEQCKRRTWNKKQIPLELHHKDGNKYNNKLENLQILCANCHSQTPNHSGRNVGGYF